MEMRKDFVTLSLETHLFFGRIMKEHSLFLMAGFPSKNSEHIKKADCFRAQFEEFLCEVVKFANGKVGRDVLQSGEIVTDFTLRAEQKTSFLSGIEIDSQITTAEKTLCPGRGGSCSREVMQMIRQLNEKALKLLDGLICFKEKILSEVENCQLFTFNYPLLIEHILREAKLYRSMIMELERKGTLVDQNIRNNEIFWNQIMMEHALFIRGLLDPTEEKLIDTADEFAKEYKKLLEEARRKDCMMMEHQTRKTLEETIKYRDFKAVGTKGITECQIAGLILPLLADHVLREANHYLRLLEESCR